MGKKKGKDLKEARTMHIQENHNKKKYREKKNEKMNKRLRLESEIDQKIMDISHCY